MRKILHITPHLGGGVGAVLLNWLKTDTENEHSVITLDYANENAKKVCKESNIELFSKISINEISSKIVSADIILIHFWSHPLLYNFLINEELPQGKYIFWSHISGNRPPYVFNEKLFDFGNLFVFSTPISKNYAPKNKKTKTVLSTSGIDSFFNIEKIPHEKFTTCYVGTLDYAKMHPKYFETLSKTKAERIIITGKILPDNPLPDCVDERFIFTDFLPDVKEVFAKSDVFAYLLNPTHYGTAEQVLQEALAAGVVPVVLNNPCEASLVKHYETGLVANSCEEFCYYIDLLKNDIILRNKLSSNGKEYAREHFSIKKMITKWSKIFDEVEKAQPKNPYWKKNKLTYSSLEVFYESLGDYSKLFTDKDNNEIRELLKLPEWSSNTKGTPKQYFEFLGGEELKKLCSLYEK